MRYARAISVLVACLAIPSTINAQTTTLSSKGTFTVGNIITTGTNAMLLYGQLAGTGTSALVRGVTTQTLFDAAGWGPLDTGVLTGLSLTGGLVSTTAQISGLLTTSGVTSVTASLTTLTASGIGTFGGVISTSATINGPLTVTGATTFTGGVQTRGYQELFGRVDIRNTQSTKLSIGTVGQAYVSVVDTNTASYLSLISGYGIGFSKDTGSTTVGLLTQTDGVLKVTNASTGVGTIYTGGFASNFRALAASGNITVTDNVVTLTGAITLSLPSTSITGQQFIVKNIGAVTGTATVNGGTKTIDGATTQAIISGAGAASALNFIYDGTNYIIGQ